jgi:prolipoprotein diacylglyceryltransferase
LSRPFGYFGGVLGGVVGVAIAGLLRYHWLLLLAAFATAAPWIQSAGRLRCLVQGCCHGAPASDTIGIRYWMPRSRVCKLGGLRGVPLHPTPLYSILSNVVIGTVLARLWALGASLGLIAGLYLLLVGCARFVEESYRGEPQTAIVRGLRIYQWFAIAFVVSGAVLTTLPVVAAPAPTFRGVSVLVPVALAVGALCGIAMGVDFPRSNRRFARLAT